MNPSRGFGNRKIQDPEETVMKNSKGRGVAGLIVLLAVLAGFAYLAYYCLTNGMIKRGLDLAGGVSITYQAKDENPSEQDMRDTIYKLQQRVSIYSDESQVYQEGRNRIDIDIPDVSDANSILEELGRPGSLTFVDPDGKVILDGTQVKSAQAGQMTDQTTGGNEYVVELTFTDEGAKAFADATTRLVGQRIAIIYDDVTYSNPVVKEAITGGQCTIDGMSSYEEADQLASTIRLGALKLELEELRSNVVGAQLGERAVSSSLRAGAVAFALIAVLMIAVFWLPGLAASLALAFYICLTIGLLAAFDITMTLPGIAGIILSVGMAVDANVIIFTRIREEIGLGKTVRSAVKTGFRKALSAIIDGNVTTLIAAAVLYFMGTGTIRGFATTLGLGVIVSMFTALLVTRMWLNTFCDLGLDNKKFFGEIKQRKTYDFLGKRKFFFGVAVAAIAAGFIGMAANGAMSGRPLNFGLDFQGGTSTNVTFNEDMSLEDIDEKVKPVVSQVTGDSDIQTSKVQGTNEVIIKTRTLSVEERQALDQALADQFGVDQEQITAESISGTISHEMRRDAVIAVVVALLLMLVYIRFRFADIRFATAAILCLCHDVLVLLACYALFRWSVGSTFVACMLTLVGYSINDTIVVFDRIRENQRLKHGLSRLEIANLSITETFSRSLLTSITTFLAILVLFIMGVSSIRDFTLPLMIGTLCGTYSSVAIASPLWYEMENRADRKKAAEKAAKAAGAAAAKAAKRAKGTASGSSSGETSSEDKSGVSSAEEKK